MGHEAMAGGIVSRDDPRIITHVEEAVGIVGLRVDHKHDWFSRLVKTVLDSHDALAARVAELEQRLAAEGLPADLLTALRDPSIVVAQDAAVFKKIAEWQNAPTSTASAHIEPTTEEQLLSLRPDSAVVRADRAEALLRQAAEALSDLAAFASMMSLPDDADWRKRWYALCEQVDNTLDAARSLIDKESHV